MAHTPPKVIFKACVILLKNVWAFLHIWVYAIDQHLMGDAISITRIDFQKAFDSIHHPSLWNIFPEYEFSDTIINILKDTCK